MNAPKSVAQAELDRLLLAHGGLSPEIVVEAAESVNSPLHNLFEWNNEACGQKYRLIQARYIIRTHSLPIEVGGKWMVTARYQIAGKAKNDGEPHYENVLAILSDADKEYRMVVAAFERARDILGHCPHRLAQKMAHHISAEILKIPRPKQRKKR